MILVAEAGTLSVTGQQAGSSPAVVPLVLRLRAKICPFTTDPSIPGPDPGDVWFPTPGDDVPTAPPSTTNPDTIPGNSSEVDACFDPDNPNLDYIFNDLLPPDDTDGTYDEELDTDVLLPGRAEIVRLSGAMRLRAFVVSLQYDLTPVVTPVTAPIRLGAQVSNLVGTLSASPGNVILTGKTAQAVSGRASSAASFALTGQSSQLVYSYPAVRTLPAEATSFVVNSSPGDVLILSHFDNSLDDEIGLIPGWGYFAQSATYKPVFDAVIRKYGASSLNFDSDFSTSCYAYISPANWGTVANLTEYTMEAYLYVTNDDYFFTIFGLGDQAGLDGLAVTYGNEEMAIYRITAGTTTSEEVYRSFVGPRENTWIHVALERLGSGYTLYLNGTPLTNEVGATPLLIYNVTNLRSAIMLGAYADVPGDSVWQRSRGNIDEFRLVNTALYKGDAFTPPTQPYTTELLSAGSAMFSRGSTVSGLVGTYILSGQSAGFFTGRTLPAESRSFTLVGQGVTFARPSLVLTTAAGDYTLTGTAIPEITYKSNTFASNTFNISFNWPTGTTIGDVGVLVLESSASSSSYEGAYPPYGWTRVTGTPFKNTTDLSAPSYMSVFYRVYGVTGNTIEIPRQGNHVAAALVVYSGVDITDPILEAQVVESPNGMAVSFPALTEYVPRTKLLHIAVGGQDSTSPPNLSGMTNPEARWSWYGQRVSVATNAGDGGSIVIGEARVYSGRLGLSATTGTSSETSNLLMTLALRPKGWTEPPLVVDFAPVAGSYALVGQAADLRPSNITFAADAGSFSSAGQDIALLDGTADTYIAAVESADGQDLETTVKVAINKFITGCKADGTWSAIKAACILAGARTLAGALVPLAGTAPTNNNFVSGDYSRTTGLVGDGSTKYLDSNRNNNADPQNSQHMAVFPTTANTTNTDRVYMGTGLSSTGSTYFATRSVDAFARNRSASANTGLVRGSAGALIGVSRSTSSAYTYRRSGASQGLTRTSETPLAGNVFVYQSNGFTAYSDARLSFYSIGESLDLALLDSRVTALMADIAAAIP